MAGCAEYSAEYSAGGCYCTVLGGSSEGPLLEYESGVEERGISCIINHLLTTRERERDFEVRWKREWVLYIRGICIEHDLNQIAPYLNYVKGLS